jgi:KipI family sensor histidine kinase inhibitor
MNPVPLSDSSVLIPIGDGIDLEINRQVHLLAAALSIDLLPGIGETVPAYASLVVHYDPLMRTQAEVLDWINTRRNVAEAAGSRPSKRIEIPVRYGSEGGEDLEFVAEHCQLGVQDVIRLHSQTIYTVYMMGFTPGFAYLGKLPDALIIPRLETPRTRVRAGTVAVAGSQTAVYPVDSPGGWRLIGHTDLAPFDARRENPFLFAPGDSVRFVPDA